MCTPHFLHTIVSGATPAVRRPVRAAPLPPRLRMHAPNMWMGRHPQFLPSPCKFSPGSRADGLTTLRPCSSAATRRSGPSSISWVGETRAPWSVRQELERRPCCTRCARELGGRATLGGAVQPLRWMPYLALQRACGITLTGTRAEVIAAATTALHGRVLLVDDLHWADPDTLELLPELAHEVAIVATVRTNDDGSAAALAVADALGSVLHIEPLPDDAARTLLLDTVPTATEAAAARPRRGIGWQSPPAHVRAGAAGRRRGRRAADRARWRARPSPRATRSPASRCTATRPATTTTRSWPASASSCTPRSEAGHCATTRSARPRCRCAHRASRSRSTGSSRPRAPPTANGRGTTSTAVTPTRPASTRCVPRSARPRATSGPTTSPSPRCR